MIFTLILRVSLASSNMNFSLFKSKTIFLKRLLPLITPIGLMSYRYTNYSVQFKKWHHSKPVDTWDTLQRMLDREILMCGFSEGVWRNDTLELSTFIMHGNLGLSKERPQGIFKFTYYRGRFKRFKMAVSSDIEIYL